MITPSPGAFNRKKKKIIFSGDVKKAGDSNKTLVQISKDLIQVSNYERGSTPQNTTLNKNLNPNLSSDKIAKPQGQILSKSN